MTVKKSIAEKKLADEMGIVIHSSYCAPGGINKIQFGSHRHSGRKFRMPATAEHVGASLGVSLVQRSQQPMRMPSVVMSVACLNREA